MKGIDQIPDFLKTLPEVELPISGARGWVIQGKEQQVLFIEFSETVEVPEHFHADQFESVIAGRVELRRDGSENEYGPGENFHLPAGVPHGAKVYSGYKAFIVFNEPTRYRLKEARS